MYVCVCVYSTVKVFDCSNAEACHKSWSVQGVVEKVMWNHHNPLQFLVGAHTALPFPGTWTLLLSFCMQAYVGDCVGDGVCLWLCVVCVCDCGYLCNCVWVSGWREGVERELVEERGGEGEGVRQRGKERGRVWEWERQGVCVCTMLGVDFSVLDYQSSVLAAHAGHCMGMVGWGKCNICRKKKLFKVFVVLFSSFHAW